MAQLRPCQSNNLPRHPWGCAMLCFGTSYTANDGLVRTATNCTRDPVAHGWIRCAAEPGVGVSHAWTVTVAGQGSGPSQAVTSYRPPLASSIRGPGSSNANTDGGQLVFITGQEFGPVSSTAAVNNDGLLSVTYGPLVRSCQANGVFVLCKYACTVLRFRDSPVASGRILFGWGGGGHGCGQGDLEAYTATNCTVVLATAPLSQIRCITAPGIGAGLYWRVTVGSQVAPSVVGPTAYGRPVVSSFAGVGSADAATTGNQVGRVSVFNTTLSPGATRHSISTACIFQTCERRCTDGVADPPPPNTHTHTSGLPIPV